MNKHIRKLLVVLQHSKQKQQASPRHQRPPLKTPEEWRTYWKEQGQLWRTEPEIDQKRQEYLAKRRLLTPDIAQGIYPFKGEQLSRADVEWLLATHENGRGPVDWSDERQRQREGVDVRGADLRRQDLSHLPLTRLCGGLMPEEWNKASIAATVLMERANLVGAQLEGANLVGAQLEGANLVGAQLEGAHLVRAQLEKADLRGAHLERASLWGAQLERANLVGAHLERTSLCKAQLKGADLRGAQLEGADLEDVILGDKQHMGPQLADAQWGNTNLAVVDWSQMTKLGDEWEAEQKKKPDGKKKEKHTRLDEYQTAVRANRQLAVALREQGLNEEADYFAYRAQRLQRVVLRRQGLLPKVKLWQRVQKLSGYLWSGILDGLAGYGYKPVRTLGWYLLVIFGFAWIYFHLGPMEGHPFSPGGALVFSLTSFHGRGFFPGGLSLEDAITQYAAFEAVVGLFIEISFIATFTQRFFGR